MGLVIHRHHEIDWPDATLCPWCMAEDLSKQVGAQNFEIDRLQKENERLRKDAARYRWLNARAGCITEGPDEECGIVVKMTLCIHTKDGGEQGLLTEWIDAAMEGE